MGAAHPPSGGQPPPQSGDDRREDQDTTGQSGGEAGAGANETPPVIADAAALNRYQTLFTHMAEGVVFQDADGRIIDANPAALRLLGLTREQLLGKTSFDPRWHAIHLDGSDAPGEKHPAMVALRTGHAVRDAILGIYIPEEDRHRWLRINAIPQWSSGHERPTGVFVTFDDITGWDYLEETARIQEARYQALLEQAADAIFVADLGGRYIEVNPAACALLGYKREELLEKSIFDVIPPEDVPRLEAIHRELAQGQTERGEWRLGRKDGVLVPVELSARITSDGRWLAIARDITERKQLEAELRQSEREAAAAEVRFHALVEQAPDALIAVDAHGRIMLVNRQAERLFGYPRDAMLDQTIELLIPKRYHVHHFMHRTMFTAHPRVRPMALGQEIFGRRADGTEFPIDVRLGPISVDGEMRIIATCRDITTHKKLEQELRERTEQLTRTIEAMNEGVYIFNRAGEAIQMNAAARELLGYGARSDLGSTRERLARLQPRDIMGHPTPPEEWPVYRVLRGESIPAAAPVAMAVTLPSGHTVILHITGAPLHNTHGQIVGAVVVARDVTRQQRLEQQRMEIFRVVAHDLATPLSAVKTYLEMQQRSMERGHVSRVPDPELMATMTHGVERMERLLGDMRTIVSLEVNKLELDRQPCDLVTLCQQEVQSMQVAKTRDLRLNLPDEAVVVEADRARLGQVLANLLSNADKYSPAERPITLTLRLERSAPDLGGAVTQQARVLVQDEGPGIPEDEQEHIWESFHRVPGTKSRAESGASLGLGLYISHEIIKHHGGVMGVESTPGKGSTFWFALPLASST